MDTLASVSSLFLAQERLHELGVPREITSSEIIDTKNLISVIGASMGKPNGQKANAPPGSKTQNNIILNMSDGSQFNCGSGWGIWCDLGTHYHLGGGKTRGGEGKPVIYRLRTKTEEQELGRNTGPRGPGWTKASDQSQALKFYELLGKQ
jgi:hypothetical protein